MPTIDKKFVPDHRFHGAPKLPTDRPPTRAEVWEHVNHWYADIKTRDEMIDWAAACWIGNYTFWVNFRGWRRQPDWKEGDELIEAACPTGPIVTGTQHRVVRELYAVAQRERTAA